MSSFGFNTTAEEVVEAFSQHIRGRTFLVTGTSDGGLGAYTATALASKGPATLILVSRNKNTVIPVLEKIASIDAKIKTHFFHCELSDNDSVYQAAKEINEGKSTETFSPAYIQRW
jgi:short-subunit dehydrogenase